MKQPYEPISVLNAFPTFATCEDYELATGRPAEPWDSKRRPKAWFDPRPKKKTTGPDGTPYTLYSNVFLGDFADNQSPVFETLMLSLAEASTVNIPPKSPDGRPVANVEGADLPGVPCPSRPLGHNQRIIRYGAMGIPTVRNTDVPLPGTGGDGFTDEDRLMLRKIATKLGA